jgi:MYXO-CTERM domain-containing protein
MNDGAVITPYGALSGNGNNLSTIPGNGQGPMNGTLPMRTFGNINNGAWDYYTVFLNQSLMNNGEAGFTDTAKWVVVANQSGGSSITASGPMNLPSVVPPSSSVPGPLPLLGAGAAFGWSRRLRRQITARHGGSIRI